MRILTICLFTALTAGLFLQGCQRENLDNYQVLDDYQDDQSKGGAILSEPAVPTPAVPDEPTAPAEQVITQASGETQTAVPVERPGVTVAQGTGPETPTERSPPSDVALPAAAMKTETPVTLPDAQAGTQDPSAPALKQEIKLLVPHKIFVPEGDSLRVTFDDIDLLKVLNMDKVPLDAVDHMPDWLKGLDGRKVTLRGWMYPPASQEGIRRFIFVRDNGVCCFGPKAKIYDKVAVTLREGHETSVIQGHAFDVTGTFTVEADILDDELMFLYFMDDCVISDK